MPLPDATSAAAGVTAGVPLAEISGLAGCSLVGDLPQRAARTAPDRCALAAEAGSLTFAELDRQSARCAAALHGLLGRPGAIVAVTAELDPAFAVAYYGVARSGSVSVLVNPLLHAEGLAHVLRASGAEAAILTPELHERLKPVAGSLPRLRQLVLTRAPGGGAGLPVLAELTAAGAGGQPAVGIAADSIACIAFTSGTTGTPKAVPLTHRNVTVNAAQTAHAQGLTDGAVLLNYLPTFHTMHLNAGMAAAATHVLHAGADVAAAIEAANRHRATHFYSLPVLLSRLAADPRLPDLRLRTARVVLSGGSALPPPTVTALTRHFGIPVVQGYGLAEASPLTHFNDPADQRPGSCGRPVAGTECRVADITTRAVLPAGEQGEVQVRGPQLMSGYLGQRTPELDGDGWFSTGDVGRIDPDGNLFLTDRLRDVFKCDNYLVSPTEIENVLRRHPAVGDCAVVDVPDEHSGAVAYGLAVLRDSAADLAGIQRFVNDQLPYYMHLRGLEPAGEIPRSRNGKVMRREIRAAAARIR